MTETTILLEVLDDGLVLVVPGKALDKRRIRVHPEHTPTTCVWLPTCELQITEGNGTVRVRCIQDSALITGEWD